MHHLSLLPDVLLHGAPDGRPDWAILGFFLSLAGIGVCSVWLRLEEAGISPFHLLGRVLRRWFRGTRLYAAASVLALPMKARSGSACLPVPRPKGGPHA